MRKHKLKEFIVTARVNAASGWQRFIVTASCEQAALDAWRNGEGHFASEEITVDEHGSVSVEENI